MLLLTMLACGVDPNPPDGVDSARAVNPNTVVVGGQDGAPVVSPTGDTAKAAHLPNILIVLMDDIGVDRLAVYGAEGQLVPNTPRIDSLAERGLRFDRAWSEPLCSPTRAGVLTGRHGWRYDLGTAIRFQDTVDLPAEALTLPEALDGYASAAVGKWHLTAGDAGLRGPEVHGFDQWAISLGNLAVENSPLGNAQGYDHWERVSNGTMGWSDRYATTVVVDDALSAIQDMKEPWLLAVSFQAGHTPFHYPPRELTTRDWAAAPATDEAKFGAMIEALDTELGRLLDGLPARVADETVVIVAGDNGTTEAVVGGKSKGTAFEAGIHVPLLVRGPGIPSGHTEALVHLVDLFPTVLELAAVARPAALDGVSLVPCFTDPAGCAPRATVFSDMHAPNGGGPFKTWSRATRDHRFKLMEVYHHELQPEVTHYLFDMDREGEAADLLIGELTVEAREAYDRLLAEMDRVVGEVRKK